MSIKDIYLHPELFSRFITKNNSGTIRQFIDENKEEYKNWMQDNKPGGTNIKILPYLQDIKNGFYVEAGAQSGCLMTSSNTKLLEDSGWSGLLVEPSSTHIESCKKNRPKSIIRQCALVSSEYIGDTILASTLDLMDDNTTQLCEARTFDSLAVQYNISHVDFFSLDVEGYEMNVLQGINFDRVRIEWFLIECNTDKYSYESLIEFMTSKGFTLMADVSNFTKENTPDWPGTHQDYLFKHK